MIDNTIKRLQLLNAKTIAASGVLISSDPSKGSLWAELGQRAQGGMFAL